jgi:hypothetical protein
MYKHNASKHSGTCGLPELGDVRHTTAIKAMFKGGTTMNVREIGKGYKYDMWVRIVPKSSSLSRPRLLLSCCTKQVQG